MKNNRPYISLKVVSKDGKVKKVGGKKIRRINKFIEANNFQDCVVNLSVTYQKGYRNWGVYETKEDMVNALMDFLEVVF